MFLNPVSITALRNLLFGYSQGLAHGLSLGNGPLASEVEGLYDLPWDFHDWVACRLHFEYAEAGWANMLIERFGDSPQALDQFFRLLDEHRVRQPKLVAIISGGPRTYTSRYMGREETLSYPSRFDLFSYNNEDPGLFAHTDDPEWPHKKRFYSSLRSFQGSVGGPSESAPIIYDQAIYDRWALTVQS
jgi:hypothetical protein